MTRPEQGEHARQAAAAGAAITRLHRDCYGRGAGTTRVVYQRNFLTVYLEDIYTPGERTLIDAGRHEAVKSTRQEFQMTMREPFSEAIEHATGRKVIAFMSQVHFNPDMAAGIFVLNPPKPRQPPQPEPVSTTTSPVSIRAAYRRKSSQTEAGGHSSVLASTLL